MELSFVIVVDIVIVICDGWIFEKLCSEVDYICMIKFMCDIWMYCVFSLVIVFVLREDVCYFGYEIVMYIEEMKVYFWSVDDGFLDDVIEVYVKICEGIDKVGGYVI